MNKNDLKVLESKRLVNSFLTVDQDKIRYRKFDGELTSPLSRMVISKQNSIGVLLHHTDRNTLLLVRQFRYPAREDQGGWIDEIVAGNIDPGESVSTCVYRETLEETGYRLNDIVPIGQGYSSPGICTEKLFLFFSEVSDEMLVKDGGGLEEEGESIEVVEWSISEARNKMQNHSILDLKTQVAVQWFFLNNGKLT